MNSRELILGRIRRALGRADDPDGLYESDPTSLPSDDLADAHTSAQGAEAAVAPAIPTAGSVSRRYERNGELSRAEIVDLFEEMVADYRAKLHRLSMGDNVSRAIARALASAGIRSPLVAPDFAQEWLPAELSPIEKDVSVDDLAAASGVVTTCAVAIARTGTIVLDGGPGQGKRAFSLVPDYHLCVIRADQVVETVPEAVSRLHGVLVAGRPLTFISGPSATSDIELSRVEGVHGPRTLEILLLE